MRYYTVIYWYTTPLNRGAHRVKNGSARRRAASAQDAAILRIKEQITAKDAADPWQLLHVEDVSDRCETGDEHESLSRLRQLEQSWLHAKQKRAGLWVPADSGKSEWFADPKKQSVDNVVEFGKSLINEWRHGVARPNAYYMRQEQQDCHDRAVAHYRSGGKKFLMNAKMRFGKTFTSYQIMRTLGARRVLVITYKPAVDASWREDIESHVDFDGWAYHSARDYDSQNPVTLPGVAPVEILFTSFQDFNDYEKAKWQIAIGYHYDLVVIDEMHYGSKTERAQDSLSQITYDRILHVSGTPLKALMSGEFLPEETYSWGYSDEQSKRRQEQATGWLTEDYRWLPPMRFHTFQLSETARNQALCYSSEEGFTMTKMWASDDGEVFLDPGSCKLFLDQFFGIGVHKNQSAVRTFPVDHMLWVLPPNVNGVNALCRMLEREVGGQYGIINVAGDNTKSLDRVKHTIMTTDKTITVTCGRFNTGVTVPEWDMVVMLDDTRAPETYFQTIFRCQSPDARRGKEQCVVVDFNPQRCLEMIYEFADITAGEGQATQDAVRQFLDFAPVLDHQGNRPQEITTDAVLNMMAETGGYAERFGSSIMLNWELAENFRNKFIGIDPQKNVKARQQVADNDLAAGKNYRSQENQRNATVDADEDARRELRQKITTMMRRLPTYLFLETERINHVSDIWRIDNQDLFAETVGVTIQDFQELCQGLIRVDRLDRCIMSYNQIDSM